MNSPARKSSLIALTLFCALVTTSHAQGAFQNLNFEAANVLGDTRATTIPITSGLPGWSASAISSTPFGTGRFSQIFYDNLALSQSMLAIDDKNTGLGFQPLQGNFSAYIAGGEGDSVTLTQTGIVPTFARSLQIEVQATAFTLGVSLGGESIEMVPLSTTGAFTIYGGNVSALAGQIAELDFTEPDGSTLNIATVDNIVFSPNSVPEPQTWTLLLCAAAVLALKRRQPKT